ncbi:uncharacterized protein LOC110195370 [Phascolarctos cinereus]
MTAARRHAPSLAPETTPPQRQSEPRPLIRRAPWPRPPLTTAPLATGKATPTRWLNPKPKSRLPPLRKPTAPRPLGLHHRLRRSFNCTRCADSRVRPFHLGETEAPGPAPPGLLPAPRQRGRHHLWAPGIRRPESSGGTEPPPRGMEILGGTETSRWPQTSSWTLSSPRLTACAWSLDG